MTGKLYVNCVVRGCIGKKNQKDSVRLFRFPRDKELCRKWAENVCFAVENVTSYLRVCERHFEPNYIGERRLDKTAIPTIALGCEAVNQNISMGGKGWRKCCIKDCRSDAEHIFHKFPKPQKYRLKWLKACGVKDSLTLHICDMHFDEKYRSKKRLPVHVVPSVNLKVPKYQNSWKSLKKPNMKNGRASEDRKPSRKRKGVMNDDVPANIKAEDAKRVFGSRSRLDDAQSIKSDNFSTVFGTEEVLDDSPTIKDDNSIKVFKTGASLENSETTEKSIMAENFFFGTVASTEDSQTITDPISCTSYGCDAALNDSDVSLLIEECNDDESFSSYIERPCMLSESPEPCINDDESTLQNTSTPNPKHRKIQQPCENNVVESKVGGNSNSMDAFLNYLKSILTRVDQRTQDKIQLELITIATTRVNGSMEY